MSLVIQHWVTNSDSDQIWSQLETPVLLLVDFIVLLVFLFSDMKLLRMMSTVILCNVICDCLYFGDNK